MEIMEYLLLVLSPCSAVLFFHELFFNSNFIAKVCCPGKCIMYDYKGASPFKDIVHKCVGDHDLPQISMLDSLRFLIAHDLLS